MALYAQTVYGNIGMKYIPFSGKVVDKYFLLLKFTIS